jgi:hypothetical protein
VEIGDKKPIPSGFSIRYGAVSVWRYIIFCPLTIVCAASHDPFPLGFSMGNGGAIIQTQGSTGRQPWNAACFYSDTFSYGVSACGIDYYDAMDNYESSHIGQVSFGGWYSRRPMLFKVSYAYLNALGLYSEQQGFLSIGFTVVKALSASIDVSANRTGLPDNSTETEKFLSAGASLFLSGRFAALSFSLSHIPLKYAPSAGFESPIGVGAGLYTTAHRFGAQGVVCEITKERNYELRFSLGESYSVSDHVALCGALSTNPFMMHFGLVISDASRGIGISFVNHPTLGWSRGLTIDYAHR